MTPELILIQVLGLIAAVLNISSVQFKRRKMILAVTIIAAVFWVAHFTLLKAYTGAALNLVAIIVVSLLYVYHGKNRPYFLIPLLMAVTVAATLITWAGPLSLLPMAGMMAGVLAFSQEKEQGIRRYSLVASSTWLVYNVVVGSVIGSAKEVTHIISTLIALWRFKKKSTTIQK